MSKPIISVSNISKRYQLGSIGAQTMRDEVEAFFARFKKPKSPDNINSEILKTEKLKTANSPAGASEFWALRDVSFDVQPGEVVGIIGRNGAGKSTLLKILSRITEPTSGEIRVRGRIASLLEVGTGFHPELSGRENIFLNGAILGMTKAEIRAKFDEIVDFAGVEQFIDTPVKRYSSGMYVRLAFAVAAHLEPEILIVDEVLAVGDAEFQKKCLGKMKDVAGHGRTILFVSHNMQAMQNLCDRVVWLENGTIRDSGLPSELVDRYLFTQRKFEGLDALNRKIASLPQDPDFRLVCVDLLQDRKSTTHFHSGKPIQIVIEYQLFKTYGGFHVYFQLCDLDETIVFESIHNGAAEVQVPVVEAGNYTATATIPADFLSGKTYEIKFFAGIHSYRNLLPKTLGVQIDIHATGQVNRAYSGYTAPGQICPLIPWENTLHDDPNPMQTHQP